MGHFDCMELNTSSCSANRGMCHLALITEMSKKKHADAVEWREGKKQTFFRSKKLNIWVEKEESSSLICKPQILRYFTRLMASEIPHHA